MGLYDRDYYQDDDSPSRTSFSGQTMVTNLVIVTAALYVINLFTADDWLMHALAATPDALSRPWLWWKLLTYGFAHDPGNLGHVFWNMVGLWIFGRDVEGVYGARELLRIYLVALLVGSLVWTARQLAFSDGAGELMGASGAVTAVILLFVFHFPHRTILLMFVLPVPAWVLGLLIIGGDLLNVVSAAGDPLVAFDVHLAGAAFAIAYFRLGWNLGQVMPGVGQWRSRLRLFRAKRRLRVHDADRDWKQEQEADRILEKVNREGMESLSSKERRALEEYSRRVRQKRGKPP